MFRKHTVSRQDDTERVFGVPLYRREPTWSTIGTDWRNNLLLEIPISMLVKVQSGQVRNSTNDSFL